MKPAHPLRVGVVTTLEAGPGAGGHVKCWLRFAEAASALPDQLDLTLHFLGEQSSLEEISPNVRIRRHRAVLGTRQLPFLRQGGGDTDLASFHPGLYRALSDCTIVHATDFFSFGRTALARSRRCGVPLVVSVHTDVPRFVPVYASEIIGRLLGQRAADFLARHRLQDWLARRVAARIERNLRHCARALVSKPEDRQRLGNILGDGRVGFLRRGIDRAMFSPVFRDRPRLKEQFGIPADRPVLLFVGRLDASKGAPLMAKAARLALDKGHDLHVLAAGSGRDRAAIQDLLGPCVSFAGMVAQKDLSWLYASSDIFVFPSMTEVAPNAVIEAKASGLPVIVAKEHGGGQFVVSSGDDGISLGAQDAASWTAVILGLLADPASRQRMGLAARAWAETKWPSWGEVLEEDLLPAWRTVASKNHR